MNVDQATPEGFALLQNDAKPPATDKARAPEEIKEPAKAEG
jgi:hypothetical protein